jgi:tetratricopeptide (TPR) repeat protein
MMRKDNILYAITGLLLGCIIGFVFANNTNQRGYAERAAAAAGKPQLPPGHPEIGGDHDHAHEHAGPDAEAVRRALKLADEQPDNFAVQLKAAETAYAAHQYDEAARLFARANKLQPDNFDAVVGLGNTNFDAERFEEAAKWYAAALRQQPDNVNIRTDLGLTYFYREPRDTEGAIREYRASLERDPDHAPTLQNLTVALTSKGDAAGARAALARLESVNPKNEVIPRLRAELDKLGGKTRAGD